MAGAGFGCIPKSDPRAMWHLGRISFPTESMRLELKQPEEPVAPQLCHVNTAGVAKGFKPLVCLARELHLARSWPLAPDSKGSLVRTWKSLRFFLACRYVEQRGLGKCTRSHCRGPRVQAAS